MKIAIFASDYYPHLGGVEELCRQLARACQAAGHSAIVVTNRWPPTLAEAEWVEGTAVYRLAMRVPGGTWRERVKFALSYRATRRRMVGILRRHQIDLIHVQCVSANGYWARVAARKLGLPIVVSTQGERTMDAGRLYQTSAFANRNLTELLGEAGHITACSRDTLEDVERFYCGAGGEPFGERGTVVYNGISLAEAEGAEAFGWPRPYVLGIGRLVPQKGFDVLLRAFAAMVNAGGDAGHDLLIAGEGPEGEALRRLSEELGLDGSGRVKFLGRVHHTTAKTLFAGCSFFVLPSRMEPQGIVNLEAMAAGKAVIAARVGGVPEVVIDGENGLLFPAEDVDALAKLLRQVSGDAELRRRLGAAGRKRAEQFDWSNIAGQYLSIYERVMRA